MRCWRVANPVIESPDVGVSAKTARIGCSAAVVLHRNEGLCRRLFADIFVDKVKFVPVMRYVVYEIPRLGLRRRDNKNSRVEPRIGGVTKTLIIRKSCVKRPR